MTHDNVPDRSAQSGPQDPRGWHPMLEKYLQALAVRNFSPLTLGHRRRYLGVFIKWAEEHGLSRPGEVTKPIVERYQRHLYHRRMKNGEPLSFRSQHAYLLPIRSWFSWLSKHNHVLYNPAGDLEFPKLEQRLPKFVLTAPEAEQVLNLPDPENPMGVRDRAIMETFYSTGIRRMELIHLSIYAIDRQRGTIVVRQGKGKKDRTVPIGDRALAWIDRYTQEVRPGLLIGDAAGDTLFLTQYGEPFTLNRMTELVGDYITAAAMGKTGACHLFRHTMATLMLENGADIRFIQDMLGHVRLSTTAIYTRVSIKKLKEVHDATHPAHLKRPPNEGCKHDPDAEQHR